MVRVDRIREFLMGAKRAAPAAAAPPARSALARHFANNAFYYGAGGALGGAVAWKTRAAWMRKRQRFDDENRMMMRTPR